MDQRLAELLDAVSTERLRDLTLDMVRIPSPTGDATAVTAYYVDTLRDLGLSVEVLDDFPGSPSTIARLGSGQGPTLTLDGHLDTIHTPHPACRAADGRIYGRGAGDMKSGVAAMVEAVRVLRALDVPLAGNLILATHSLHEAPVGHMEGLKALIARGDVFVDAALVAECGFDELYIRGKGQAIFEIDVTRAGGPLHENEARPLGIPNPLDHVVRLADRLLREGEALAGVADPLLGPETFFLGQVHGGDFYNRVPSRASLNGTYRYGPDKDWPGIHQLFDDLLASIPHHPDLKVATNISGNGLGYAVPPEAPIVEALRGAYQTVVGRSLPLATGLSVCDVNVIIREAGIPAVSHGTGTTTAHADLEWVALEDVVRTTRVFLATIINYLGIASR
ncbi:MAG: M20 family metallopeptidase [Anaerolineae bacterium]